MWILGTGHKFSERATSVLNFCTLFPAPLKKQHILKSREVFGVKIQTELVEQLVAPKCPHFKVIFLKCTDFPLNAQCRFNFIWPYESLVLYPNNDVRHEWKSGTTKPLLLENLLDVKQLEKK